MTNLSSKPYFIAPALSHNSAGYSGQGRPAQKPGKADGEFASVLEAALAEVVAVPVTVKPVAAAAVLSNSAYWSHPAYMQMKKAS